MQFLIVRKLNSNKEYFCFMYANSNLVIQNSQLEKTQI